MNFLGKTITHQQYNEIVAILPKKSSSLLAVQIAYYAGLRWEVTGLSWDDINLEEQYLTVRRSKPEQYRHVELDLLSVKVKLGFWNLRRNLTKGEKGTAQATLSVRTALSEECTRKSEKEQSLL